jgi:signal transduction histidine kinase
MTSFSRMIVSELGANQTERQRLYADQLRASSEQCVALLEQLMAYSQVQGRTLAMTQHDPTAAVRLCWRRLTADAQLEGAEFSVEPLGVVFADADLLSQAIATILDNAIKFRRRDVPARVAVEAAHDEEFWRMRVRDNGVGVDVRHREAAFSMFRRLNSAGAYPGVGAGLAICRRIARRHGGEAKFVDCEEGACLEFALPHVAQTSNRRFKAA